MTEKKFSPGILKTNFGEYRLLMSRTINRDDEFGEYLTFLATPKLDKNDVHVPGRAITVSGNFEIDWFPHFIEVSVPLEDDPDFKDYIEDVETDQEPIVDFPADFEPKEMGCGV